jgi:uncharacterized membrane protein YqjE
VHPWCGRCWVSLGSAGPPLTFCACGRLSPLSMNRTIDSGPLPSSSREPLTGESSRATLVTSLLKLIDSRLALIQLESADAGGCLLKKAACFAGACFCVVSAWILLVAALIKIIADAAHWPWSWVAVGMAILHLLLGFFFSRTSRSVASPSYPATRAEFRKDREWIENISSRKSND